MDIFLKQFQDVHNRKGRVEQFFESDLFSQSNDKPIIFDLGNWMWSRSLVKRIFRCPLGYNLCRYRSDFEKNFKIQ